MSIDISATQEGVQNQKLLPSRYASHLPQEGGKGFSCNKVKNRTHFSEVGLRKGSPTGRAGAVGD